MSWRTFFFFGLWLTGGAAVASEELWVFAASSTAEALTEVGAGFHAATGIVPRFAYGSSSDLARQLKAGAPADVFLSADLAQMAALEQAGLVPPGARVDLLSNELVLVVPAGSKQVLRGPADLRSVKRLALADPQGVPAGVYAKAWLTREGLWDAVKAAVIPALDVRAALAMVAAGRAEAGIVYRTDAAHSPRVRVAYRVPAAQGPRIVYPVAPLTKGKRAAATAFIEFLLHEHGRSAFEKAGFIVLERPR